jgi:hypothetical protein
VVALRLEAVSQALWRERHLLDLLVCKVEVENLLLASGRTSRLASVNRELEQVLEGVVRAARMRAVAVEGAALALTLPPGPTLRQVAGAAPPPWDHIFEQHRLSLASTAEELQVIGGANRDLLRADAAVGNEWVDRFGATAGPGGELTVAEAMGGGSRVDLAGRELEVSVGRMTRRAALEATLSVLALPLAAFVG